MALRLPRLRCRRRLGRVCVWSPRERLEWIRLRVAELVWGQWRCRELRRRLLLVLILVERHASRRLIRRVWHCDARVVLGSLRWPPHGLPRIGLWLQALRAGLHLLAESSVTTIIEVILVSWRVRWGA